MKFFKSIAFYLALIGVIFAVVITIRGYKEPPPLKPVEMPSLNPFPHSIAASGIIESVDKNIFISAPESGLVREVFVKVSQKVKKGDPLFKIDDRELQAQLLVQKANIEVSKANLERLKDQLSRLEAVKDPRAISQDELKTRRNDVKVAESQLNFAISQAKQTELLIDRLLVTSPIDGTVLQSDIRPGEYVNTSNNNYMLLGNLHNLQVRIDIDEQNAVRFRPGTQAIAFPKNQTSVSFPLTFERVEPYVIPKKSLTGASEERVDTRVLQVIFLFEKPPNIHLYVGQQVDAFIETDEVK